jgi:hypothetical protein
MPIHDRDIEDDKFGRQGDGITGVFGARLRSSLPRRLRPRRDAHAHTESDDKRPDARE